jgi:hypothetical protein
MEKEIEKKKANAMFKFYRFFEIKTKLKHFLLKEYIE